MKKTNKFHSGMKVGIVAAVVLLIVLAALVVQSIYKSRVHTQDAPNVVSSTPIEAYTKATKVPADWESYTIEEYSLSGSHPKGWLVLPDSRGNPSTYDYEIGLGVSAQNYEAVIGINKKSLDDVVQRFKDDFLNNGSIHPRLLSEKAMYIDGHLARELRYQQMHGVQGGSAEQQTPGQVERQYFVYSNGMTYSLPTVYESDQPNGQSANNSLMLFESITIE